jgi:hypothetical protein
MAELPLDQAVPRFKANEDRLDTFVNSATGYTTSGGTSVQSIQQFLASIGSNGIDFVDNAKARFGTGNDLEIYHSGSGSFIRDTGTGDLTIDGSAISIQTASAERVSVSASGIDVTGTVEFDGLSGTGTVTITDIADEDNMASNSATKLATQQSIKAYVDAQVGTADTLSEVLGLGNTTGSNNIEVTTAQKVQFRDSAIYINSSADGQLDLVADTEIQIAATTVDVNGVLDVSGNIVVGGTVDSRDLATDGTKLDGIEAGATADQTAAQIKTAYESNSNTNAFTDADHTKLDGIATGADVTLDEISAGANVAISAGGVISATASGGITNVVDDTSPELGGDLTLNSHDIIGTGNIDVTGNIEASGNISLPDNSEIRVGTGNDLKISHNATNSIITNSTGFLDIRSDTVHIDNAANNEKMAQFTANGSVDLYYDNAKKLETTSSGIDVTGAIDVATSGASNTSKGLAIATSGTNFESDGGIISIDHAASGAVTGGYFSKYSAGGTLRHSIKGDGKGYFAGGIDVTGGIEVANPTNYTGIHLRGNGAPNVTFGRNNVTTAEWKAGISGNLGTSFTISEGTAAASERLTIATGGDVSIPSGNLNATRSGGSTLTLENSITSISANELIGGIDFKGNDTSEDGNEVLAFIRANALDTTPDSCIRFGTLQNNGGVDDVVTERMRLDNYGRLGIGTTSPSVKLQTTVANSSTEAIRITNDTDAVRTHMYPAEIQAHNSNLTLNANDGGFATVIKAAGAERMRIDSNGNVGIGDANPSAKLSVTGGVTVSTNLNVGNATPAGGGTIESHVQSSSTPALITYSGSSSLRTHISFENVNGQVGKINTTGTQTFYVTSSDYRLKTDIQPMQGSIDRVKALKPCNFEWVNDGGRVDGFIAHEAQEVVPEAIVGDKDAMQDQQYVESEATGDIYTPAIEATYETIQVELTPAVEAVYETVTVEISPAVDAVYETITVEISPAVEATYDDDGNELTPAVEAITEEQEQLVTPAIEAVTEEREQLVTPAVEATYEEQEQELTPAIDEVIHSSDVEKPDELEEGQLWRETTEKVMATRQVPDYQGIDQSKIVPLLTSALQDAIAKIEALETRLEALEA